MVVLGKVLETWKAHAGDASIYGLDKLLQGRYPEPCEPYETEVDESGRLSIPTPWRYCFARVITHERLMSEGELWRSLQEAVPADVGQVTQADSGHY